MSAGDTGYSDPSERQRRRLPCCRLFEIDDAAITQFDLANGARYAPGVVSEVAVNVDKVVRIIADLEDQVCPAVGLKIYILYRYPCAKIDLTSGPAKVDIGPIRGRGRPCWCHPMLVVSARFTEILFDVIS